MTAVTLGLSQSCAIVTLKAPRDVDKVLWSFLLGRTIRLTEHLEVKKCVRHKEPKDLEYDPRKLFIKWDQRGQSVTDSDIKFGLNEIVSSPRGCCPAAAATPGTSQSGSIPDLLSLWYHQS
jgi:hypothetical protein